MKEKFVKALQSNSIVWMYLAVSLIIELTGVCITSGRFFIRMPYMFISLLAIGSFVLFSIRNQIGRYWCAFVLLFVQFAIDVIFILVFEMTGSTFDFSMLKLRNDAVATIESVPINFIFVSVSGACISLYMLFAHYIMKLVPAPARLLPHAVTAAIMALIVGFHGTMAYVNNRNYNASDLSYKLYAGTYGAYYDNGIFGNFVNELYKGAFFNKVEMTDENELERELYSTDTRGKETDMFGKAEGYNVVTILAESFEWFSFMNNLTDGGVEEAYPGGFDLDDEIMAQLHSELYAEYSQIEDETERKNIKSEITQDILRGVYKNLYKLYDTSVACVNNHAREKTDISENHAILGNYPTDFYINYDYPKNTLPFSMPNLMKNLFGVESNSFHNGQYTFYNRDEHHVSALGFEKFYASEQMMELNENFVNDTSGVGEHNLDSMMIDTCKEVMFPSDRRFYTFITTITMHGQYTYRDVLEENGYYKTLNESGLTSALKKEDKDYFLTYAAAALDLDRAIGEIFDYLENTKDASETPLIDKTVIAIYGDHNAYYHSLTNKVKNLYLSEKNGRNYADLFRVPLMFRIGNGEGARKITKFTTTTDIVPTLLDLLGVHYFDQVTYGHSVFSDVESIIYSRAYNEFVADKIYFSSLNNIRFICDDVKDDDAYIKDIENRALEILRKTSMMNKIYYYDFLSGTRADDFYSRLYEINRTV